MSNRLFNQLNSTQQTPQQNNILAQAMQMQKEVQQSGMTPQQYFYQKVQSMGVDSQPILAQAEQMAKMFKMM